MVTLLPLFGHQPEGPHRPSCSTLEAGVAGSNEEAPLPSSVPFLGKDGATAGLQEAQRWGRGCRLLTRGPEVRIQGSLSTFSAAFAIFPPIPHFETRGRYKEFPCHRIETQLLSSLNMPKDRLGRGLSALSSPRLHPSLGPSPSSRLGRPNSHPNFFNRRKC